MKYILILILITNILNAKHLNKEKYYQKIFCDKIKGITEYKLKDKTRVDCLTSTYAIEVDFAYKWAESIGQSLYYSTMTKKRPGILLILENKKRDTKYLKRLEKVSNHIKSLNIQIWTIDRTLLIKKLKY